MGVSNSLWTRRFIIFALLFSTAIFSIIPAVYAAGPAVVQTKNGINTVGVTQIQVVFTNPTAIGNTLIVQTSGWTKNGNLPSILDSQGNTFIMSVNASECSASCTVDYSGVMSIIWSAIITGATADTVTVNYPNLAKAGVGIMEVSGLGGINSIIQCSGVGTTNPMQCSGGAMAFSGSVIGICGSSTQGSTANNCSPATQQVWGSGPVVSEEEYYLNAATTWNPSRSFSGAPGEWAFTASVFGTSSTSVIITSVVACNAYQLQCWLYPSFFLGVYLVLMMGITLKGGVSGKDNEGIVLEGLALGSLIAVIMGMISIMIPLLITVVHVIRTLRA